MASSSGPSQVTVTPMAASTSAMISTSVIRGTLTNTCRPSASRQAAMSFSTEFLAPPARTVPERGPLELTTNRSTGPVCPLAGVPPGDLGASPGAALR